MEYEDKLKDIGQHARVLIDLHLEKPKEFNANVILEKLIKVYEKHEFEPIKPYEEIKE